MLEDNQPERIEAVPPYPANLYMLIDVYKHHLDLFFKAFAFFVFAILVVVGFIFSWKDINVFQKIFVGITVSSASAIALFAIRVSARHLSDIAERIDRLSEKYSYEKIPFSGPTGIVTIFNLATWLLLSAGLLYIIHVLIFGNGYAELTTASPN